MKLNKYWILAIVGLFLVVVGGVVTMVDHGGTTAESKNATTSSSQKETDSDYAKKKFLEIKNSSKNSNIIVVLYEPGKAYTDTFLNMVKEAEKQTDYSDKPKVVYFKGDSFVTNWTKLGYAANSGTENNSKNIMKTNILTLKKGEKLDNLIGEFSEGRSLSDNSADKNGGTAIDAPIGAFGLHKNEYIDDNVEYNDDTLSKLTSNNQIKESVQEHVVNFAFSWFNDELYHRN